MLSVLKTPLSEATFRVQIMNAQMDNSPEDNDRRMVTVKTIQQLKGKRPIVAVTAYDAAVARLVDPFVDWILVGDSVGNNQLGFSDTVPVTLDMMVHHTAAVCRAGPKSLVVSDVPFALAYRDLDVLLDGCCRLLQEGGARAVKIEVGSEAVIDKIKVLVEAGIPVVGHIGLLPQTVQVLGGYRSFGKHEQGRMRLLDWAKKLEQAGCFSVLGEMVAPAAALAIKEALEVPFIGIGCGAGCDGQILVINDILGLNEQVPGFVKRYGDLAGEIRKAVGSYADDVRAGRFPEPPRERG